MYQDNIKPVISNHDHNLTLHLIMHENIKMDLDETDIKYIGLVQNCNQRQVFILRVLYFSLLVFTLPVSVVARSKASTVFGRSNIGITGSNPARGIDVCLCFSVLCCPV
jgi:hypothetical protein